MAAAANNQRVLVARVIAPHGITGAVTADSFSDYSQRFSIGAVFTDEQNRTFTIASASQHKGRLLLHFTEITDRAQAEKLRGISLYIDEKELPPLPEDSWYQFQLIGLEVRQQGKRLGELIDVLTYTANDVYVMRRDDGQEILIPALKQIVRRVDLAEGSMEVVLPEGL